METKIIDAEFEVIEPGRGLRVEGPTYRWWQGWRIEYDWRAGVVGAVLGGLFALLSVIRHFGS